MILQQAVAELFTQAICYGLYIPTFSICIRWLLCENEGWKLRPYKQIAWSFIIIAIIIFAIATADIAIAVWLTFARLVGDQLVAERLSYTSVAIEGIALIIIDAVLIYRCWVVYAHNWRIIFLPLILWVLTVTCAVTWVVCNSIGMELINSPIAITIGVGVFYACNFATNVYATTAIVHRVWKTGIASRQSRIHEVCRTIAGTGILYSFTSFLTLVATLVAISFAFPLSIINAINFPTACIAYNLVIIRVGQLRANSHVPIYNSNYHRPDLTTKDSNASTTKVSK